MRKLTQEEMKNELDKLVYDVAFFNKVQIEHNTHITIYELKHDINDMFKTIEYGINWCAFGTVDFHTTEMFTEDLKKAVREVKDFNRRLDEIYNGE